MLQLNSVHASYENKTILSDVSITIMPGEKVAFVGRSGSGKSTLLKLLYETTPKSISLVPQEYGLVKSLSVFHNVYMGQLGKQNAIYNLVNLIKPLSQPIKEVEEILKHLQLSDKIFEPVSKLSGGQQQRVAIARAFMQGGETLLADEPVSSLDEKQSKLVMQNICSTFSTVVLAMHDIDLALSYCDRIIGLKNGSITLDAKSEELNRADLLELYGD